MSLPAFSGRLRPASGDHGSTELMPHSMPSRAPAAAPSRRRPSSLTWITFVDDVEIQMGNKTGANSLQLGAYPALSSWPAFLGDHRAGDRLDGDGLETRLRFLMTSVTPVNGAAGADAGNQDSTLPSLSAQISSAVGSA